LGIDDGRFLPHSEGAVGVVGVVYRGGYWFEGVMHTTICIDGLDATERIAAMINSSPFYKELRVVFLDGITLAGFNVVDIKKLFLLIDLPVISITRKKPDLNEIKRALKNLSNFDERIEAMKNAGVLLAFKTRNGENPVYIQKVGILCEDAKKILRMTSTRSNIPEALRVAHIIASGLTGLRENI
jgi:endonuclease V-like protein UPF0215 family